VEVAGDAADAGGGGDGLGVLRVVTQEPVQLVEGRRSHGDEVRVSRPHYGAGVPPVALGAEHRV
jgi:hypothetical protein